MGNFSRVTFNALKHYVGVRLQQGVPIVDADWNEMEDIRKYELQAFLKWFVGNGVPYGNDGFKITAVAATNDFAITGGDGTPDGAGRCLVDGLDVMNESPLNYTDQTLYDDAALAAEWGVDPLDPLSAPTIDLPDTVYLDVWEREVDSTEDPDLINDAIGIETAVRHKREWVVRVKEGAPNPPTPAAGHAHYVLAYLNREAGNENITTATIADRRTKGLRIPSYYDIQQMKQDAFGNSYTLDNDGQPNLPVSLREAINALLRGGLPATPAQQLTTDKDLYPSALYASNGNIWLFWSSTRNGNSDIWYMRYNPANDSGGLETPFPLNTDIDDTFPVTVEDSNDNIWVFWISDHPDNEIGTLYYGRYNDTTLWQGDTLSDDIVYPTNILEVSRMAVADSSGGVWVFWQSSENDIWSNHYTPGGGWQGNEQRTSSTDIDNSPYAVAASNGDIWLFWSRTTGSNTDIWSARYERSTGAWQAESPVTSNSAVDRNPVAIEDDSGTMWVFWLSDRSGNLDIWYSRYHQFMGRFLVNTALTTDVLAETNLALLCGTAGRIWVFWSSYAAVAGFSNVSYKTYTTESGWGSTVHLTSGVEGDFLPVAIEDGEGKVHAFWTKVKFDDDFTVIHLCLWTRVLTPQI